ETILLKALQKDPEQRYQSAAALADDVERYLSNQPILARGPSPVYQARRFVRRHWLGTAGAALIFLLGIGAAIAIAIEASRARAAARRAERTKEFLETMLATADPQEG